MSANLFYVDLYNGRICGSNGEPLRFPEVVAGGTVSYALRFLEYFGRSFVETDQDLVALRVGIGPVDERPITGRYRLKLGLASTEVGVNTTDFLDVSARAPEVESALNALSGKEASFACMDVPGAVMIRRVDGASEALSVVSNRIVPVSFGRISGVETDGEWSYELRLSVAPYAFSDSAVRVLPEAPTISTILDGGADSSGTYYWNEIQQLHVPPNFRGLYQLRYGDFAKTRLLDSTDGATQLEEAINQMFTLPDGTIVGSVAVKNPKNDYAHIEFQGDLGGQDLPELVVAVFNGAQGDWTFDLPLDRAELFFALRQSDVLTLPFEAEADFYIDPQNHSAGIVTRKLWQTTIRVRRPQIWPGTEAVPGIDWLRINPVDYVPFTPNQIVTGPQVYSQVIGNGTVQNFVITHGMNTLAIANIIVRTNTEQWHALVEGEDYNASISSADEISLSFPTPPAEAGLLVYVQSAPSVRQWDAHTHTQEQIEGLKPLLDNILERIVVLEALLPKEGAPGKLVGPPITFVVPDIGEVLPDIAFLDENQTIASQVIVGEQDKQTFPDGTDVAQQMDDIANSQQQAKEDPDALPPNVLYRVTIPGVGKTATRGKDAVVGSDGTVTVPAVPEEPSEPAVWPARSATMAKTGKWPLLLPAQTQYSIEIDLAEYFPPFLANSGQFHGEHTFGPWEVDVRIVGTISVDDELYINGSVVEDSGGSNAGSVDIDMILSAGTPLVIDVRNHEFPNVNNPDNCSAQGILSVIPQSIMANPVLQLPALTPGIYVVKTTSGLTLPAGSGRKAQSAPYDSYFASDGRCFYRVNREGDVYHALEMDRELWRVMVEDSQFPQGSTLSVSGEIRTRMLGDFFDDDARLMPRVDYGAQYLLKCEAVPMNGLFNTGSEMLGAAGTPVVLGQTRVALSPALETFKWSLSIRREDTGMVSSWLAYRKASSGGDFSLPAVIRLRLSAFDIDDSSSDPRGQIALIMPSTKLQITV